MRQAISLLSLLALGLIACWAVIGADVSKEPDSKWTTEFPLEKGELSSTGRNPYFVLEPGYQLTLEDDDERLVITVTDQTKTVDGIETRIVEERETKGGQLIEVSRNFFAISKRTGSVFYFGEEVDMYKDGKIASHDGAWLSGVNGAKFGLMIPGQVLLGGRYYQEIAKDVALDRAEIVSMSESLQSTAGEFKGCVKTEETTPLEPGVKEYKLYAPGIGLVQDGSLKLVKHGKLAAQ